VLSHHQPCETLQTTTIANNAVKQYHTAVSDVMTRRKL